MNKVRVWYERGTGGMLHCVNGALEPCSNPSFLCVQLKDNRTQWIGARYIIEVEEME